MQYHGGDIYRNQIRQDFSVNTNPLGMPDSVREALHQAVEEAEHYPDIHAQELTNAVAEQLRISEKKLVFGNGASELFHAVLHAVKPSKILIPVPSFLGYEEAAKTMDCEVIFYEMKKEEKFCLTERILDALDESISLVFLANPNNPVGNLVEPELILEIAEKCRHCDITLVLDECFMELTGKEQKYSFLSHLEEFPNVVVVRAFTKLYAIPGVRLGYLVCEQTLAEKIRLQMPEWNLSVFAQRAGVAAIKEQGYVARAVACIQTQRLFLREELKAAGCIVYDSDADYLLFYSEKKRRTFLQRGILIRDCSNFRGTPERLLPDRGKIGRTEPDICRGVERDPWKCAGSRICTAGRDRGAQFCNYHKRTGRTWYCDPERAGAGDKKSDPHECGFRICRYTYFFGECSGDCKTPDPHRSGYRDRHKYGALRCQQKSA